MLKLKDETVSTDGTQRQIWFALGIAEGIFQDSGYDCIVTSLTDGVHNPESLHPKGLAADLRTKQMTGTSRRNIYVSLNRRLRIYGFDVVWEGSGATPATSAQHIHVEYDPKPDGGKLPL